MEITNINGIMDNVVKIINILVTIIIAFITAYFTNRNERKKQTTVFFKQEGIKVQQEILNFWCSILFYDYKNTVNSYIKKNTKKIMDDNSLNRLNEITETMAIIDVQKASYMYSSKLTIKYIGCYIQDIFKEEKKEKQKTEKQKEQKNKKKRKNNNIEQLFLVSKVICNMKYDFTGEKTSTMNLLRMKINDLDVWKRILICLYAIKYFLVIKFY